MRKYIQITSIVIAILVLLFSCKRESKDSTSIASSTLDSLIKKDILKVDSFRQLHQFDEAFTVLQSLRNNSAFNRGQDTSRAIVYHKFGVMNFLQNDFNDARLYLDTAIVLVETMPQRVANSYYVRALAKMKMELNEDALSDLLKCIDHVGETAPTDQLANYYTQVAELSHKVGDMERSENYFEKVLDLYKGDENEALANYHNNRGNFYAQQGIHDLALGAYKKAQKIYLNLGEKTEEGYLLATINIALSYIRKAEFEKGKEQLLSSIEKINETGKGYFTLQENCFNALAYLEVQRKDFFKAEEYYRQLLDLGTKTSPSNYSVTLARSYEGIADSYVPRKKYTEGITNYHKAIQRLCINFSQDDVKTNPSLKEHVVINKIELLRILNLKAQTWIAQYDSNGDSANLEEALKIFEIIDELLDMIRQRYKTFSARYALIEENISLYDQAVRTALQLFELSKDSKYVDAAFHFASKNKAIILQDGLQDENAKYSKIPSTLIAEEKELIKERYNLEAEIIELEASAKKEGLKEKEVKRFDVIRAYEKLTAKLENDFPEYFELKYQKTQKVNASTIASQLPDESAIIEYFIGIDSLFVFTISKAGIKHYMTPKPDNLDTLCTAFRTMFQNNNTPPSGKVYSDVAFSLYQFLLQKPLADLQLQGNIKRLIIIPDDYLAQLSFDALLTEELANDKIEWTNKDIPYLLRKYALSYAYSNRLLFDSRGTKRIKKSLNQFAGFGLEYDDFTLSGIQFLDKLKVDTVLTRGMGKLHNSVDEIIEVKEIVGNGNYWTDQKATKDAFIKHAPASKIIHLAMHGFESNTNPLNSALIFSREKKDSTNFLLKTADLYSMELQADLAVLSACHTGYGAIQKGEGVRSLARAFRYAGCQSLVATLWSISDKSTKEIMIDFYTNLKEGDHKDVAMQKAKINYMRRAAPSRAMPSFWTNLVLIGDADPLEF